MRRAAMWLFLIMIVSYSIAYGAVRDMHISWDDDSGLVINDGIVLFSDGDRSNIDDTQFAEISDVKRIEIKGISSDMRIVSEDRDNMQVDLNGYYVASGSYIPPELIVTSSGSTVFIEVKHTKQLTNFTKVSLDLLVTVPQAYTSGLQVESVSSDVDIVQGEYEWLNINTVSGDVKVDNVKVDDLSVDTTSGEIDLENGSGKVSAESVSGDVDLRFVKLTDDIDVQTTSGEVKIMVPDTENFQVDFRSTSGGLRSLKSLDNMSSEKRKLNGVMGSGSYDIEVSTVSGDITLR